jgi:tetratricopeptide (TPR) repeat protein
MSWIKAVAPKTEVTQTVCTGAFVLAKAGLLDNLEITTWYGAIEHMRKLFPNVTVKDGRRFIDNGRYVTTAGISAGIDGSIHVIARLLGRRVADSVARYMEYHWTPDAYLAKNYVYLNPSTDERGRIEQSADMQAEEKNHAAAAKAYRELLAGHEDNGALWMALGSSLKETGDHAAAADAFARGATSMPHGGYTYYLASVEFAKAKQNDRAADMLTKAWAAGFHERETIQSETALASVLNDPRVKEALR